MNIKLSIAHFIRWHELKLAWKVLSREYILQHNLFGDKWKEFNSLFNEQSLDALLKNLDEKSVGFVHLLLKRFSNPLAIYPSLYPRDIFSEEEIAEQINFKKVKHDLSRKYNIAVSEVDPSPMMYQSGLCFVPNNIKARLRDSAVLDIGAYIGQATVSFLDFQPAQVYSFEPSKRNFKKLSNNLGEHVLSKKVIPVNIAMGDKKGFAYISDEGNASSVGKPDTNSNAEKVIVSTVNDFTKENGIARVGLIKLDVEGFEMNVVQGALETIIRDKPIVLISIYHTPTDFFKIKPMLEDLNLGYRFLIRKTNPFWLTYDSMLIGYVA